MNAPAHRIGGSEPTAEQQAELARLKAWFPFRIVYGAISPDGVWESAAVTTMRQPNALARKGWQVWTVK